MSRGNPFFRFNSLFEADSDSLSALLRRVNPGESPVTKRVNVSGVGVAPKEVPHIPDLQRSGAVPPPEQAKSQRGAGKRGLAAVYPVVPDPPGAFHPYESSEPTMAERHRPDLPHPEERFNSFHASYHHPKNRLVSIRHVRESSSNPMFHGSMEDGSAYMSKPLAAAREAHEPEHFAKRHDAVYRWLSMVGAHHMGTPGFESDFHGHAKIPDRVPAPSDSDIAERPGKVKRMARVYADPAEDGSPHRAHVTQHVDSKTSAWKASQEDLDKVDGEHRLTGILTHALFGNPDGHGSNVLLHHSGHPILLDHDLVLSSRHSQAAQQHHGKKAVLSVFGHGGMLDYRNRTGEVGKNYPERMRNSLEWLADGGHTGGSLSFGLSREDAEELRNNARDLLNKGLEGTLAERHQILDGARRET